MEVFYKFGLCALLFWIQSLQYADADVYCFKKVHRERKNQSICRGLIQKHGRMFRSPKGCCRNGGAGYYTTMETLGRRGKKYVCQVCSDTQSMKTTTETVGLYQESNITTRAPPLTTTRPLISDLLVPVENKTGWSEWSMWTDCSVTCGLGYRQRRRICYDANCFGDDVEMEHCALARDCPVDGNWGPWREWSECSRTCGGGYERRVRVCNDPPPLHNGKDCEGLSYEQVDCNTNGCPVDGGWSDWENATECSKTCGTGIYIRRRTCTNPAPQHGGRSCEGRSEENMKCRLGKCPIDGGWTLWTNWSECDVTCGNSTRARYRECTAPVPKHGGQDCLGDESEVEQCFALEPCPVDGNWADWGPWGPCLAIPCKGQKGNQTRSRTCTNPQPRFRGSMCIGSSVETQECFNNFGCPVNGEWCDWSSFTECLPYNQGMFRRRDRLCGCPLPESGGLHCIGDDFEVESCSPDGSVLPCSERKQLEGSGFIDADDEDC